MKTPDFIKQRSEYPFYFLLGSIAVGFVWLLRNSTLTGPGLINDSIAYIAGARSILAGTGYSQVWLASELQPITHYPPLFSLILVFVGMLGIDPLFGARIVNILLLGANIILIGILGWKIFKNRFAGLSLALFFAISGAIFRIHSYVISEPLFLFFCLVSFLLLELYFANGRKIIWIILLGVIVGLAILDRYVGFVLFVVVAAVLFLFEQTWRTRLTRPGIYVISSVPLPLAWLIYNSMLTGAVADRGLSWHPITTDDLLLGVANLSHWLFPLGTAEADQRVLSVPGVFISIILGAFLLLWLIIETARLFKGSSSSPRAHPIIFMAGLFSWMYPVSILVSISLFDHTTRLQDRILVPAYLSLLIVLVWFGVWLWRLDTRIARTLAILGGILILGVWFWDFYGTVFSMQQDGQGYSSRRIRESAVIQFVAELPEDVSIYTDSPPSIYSGTARPSFVVFVSGEEGQYPDYYSRINREVRAGRAILVLFDAAKYDDPGSQANYQSLTAGTKMIVRFGTQRAFMGEQ